MSEHTVPWTLTQDAKFPWTYTITDCKGLVAVSESLMSYSSQAKTLEDAVSCRHTSEEFGEIGRKANAYQRARLELIVRSVNLLHELVEALREAKEPVQYLIDEWGEDMQPEAVALLAKIDALIAKATAP